MPADSPAKSSCPATPTQLLLKRLTGAGDQARMPMGGKPLAADQIDIIKAWIDQPARVWPDAAMLAAAEIKKHWAFVPPVRPPVRREADDRRGCATRSTRSSSRGSRRKG